MIASGAHATLSAAAVNLVMSAQEDPEVREAVLATTLIVPDGQPLVWALRALGHGASATRVYGPDLMAPRVRPCGRREHADVPLRRSQRGRARRAHREPARRASPASRSPAPTRRRSASSPPRRTSRSRSASTRAARRLVWVGIGPAAPGAVDGAHAPAPRGARAGRGRRRVRLPRRARLARRPPGWAAAGSSGRTGSRTSRGGCGGATPATTRASSRRSRASTPPSAVRALTI